jgi:hypothetical protein
MSSVRRPATAPRRRSSTTKSQETVVNPATGRRIRVGGRAMAKAARDAGVSAGELKREIIRRNRAKADPIYARSHPVTHYHAAAPAAPKAPNAPPYRASIRASHYRTHSGYMPPAEKWYRASEPRQTIVRHVIRHPSSWYDSYRPTRVVVVRAASRSRSSRSRSYSRSSSRSRSATKKRKTKKTKKSKKSKKSKKTKKSKSKSKSTSGSKRV